MNTKTRITIAMLIMSLLAVMIAPAAMANDEFNLLTNNNEFDTPDVYGFASYAPWILAKATSDVLDCSNTMAFSGPCSFFFKGSPAENSSLKQVVTGTQLDTINAFAADAPVSLRMSYVINSLSEKTNMKALTVVKLSNGTSVKSLASFTGSTKIGEYTSWQTVDGTSVVIPQGVSVTKVVVKFANKGLKGKAFIDDVNVLFASAAS